MSNLLVPKVCGHHGSAMRFFQCSKVLLLFNDAGPRKRFGKVRKKGLALLVLTMCSRKLCACISPRKMSTKNAPTLKMSVRMRLCTLCTCLYIQNCPPIHIFSWYIGTLSPILVISYPLIMINHSPFTHQDIVHHAIHAIPSL